MKKFLIAVLILIIIGGIWFWREDAILTKAHSTFENYYAFRGCTQLIQKTDTYGICKTGSGQTIKIVLYNGKWYLDGDLPWGCIGGMCFGL